MRHSRARGRGAHVPGQMNKMEEAYAKRLEELRLTGQIEGYVFEAVKLKLASRTFYTPDFLVIAKGGFVELHEVKGHWEDDARVKIKVAARQFPWFSFVAITKKKGEWCYEDFPNT